jgi:hypothetical protein
MTETKEKKTRRKLSVAEQKEKLAKAEKLLAEQKAKLAVESLKEYVTNLKITSVTDLFSQVKAGNAGVKDIDILRTIAEIVGLKVVITDKPKIPRAKNGTSKAKGK